MLIFYKLSIHITYTSQYITLYISRRIKNIFELRIKTTNVKKGHQLSKNKNEKKMYTLFSQTLKATANLFEISLRLPIHCAYFWSSLSYIIPQLPLFQVIREGTSPFYNSLLPHIKLKSITWSFIKARVQQLVGPTLQTENKELFFPPPLSQVESGPL